MLALAVQFVGLYSPSQLGAHLLPGEAAFANADKVVHFAMFAAVGFCAVKAFGRPGLVVGLLVSHAVVSELIQGFALPSRSGDPLDAICDTAGSVCAVWLAVQTSRAGRGPRVLACRLDDQ